MLGPVQVLVVTVAGVQDEGELMAAVAALPDDGPVRCLDVFGVTVAPDGELVVTGADPPPPSLPLFAELVDAAAPVAPVEGTWHLGEVVPPESRAVVALLEHQWALGLRDSMRAAGGSIRHEAWLDEEDRTTLESLLEARSG
jgi:hypothetical protein